MRDGDRDKEGNKEGDSGHGIDRHRDDGQGHVHRDTYTYTPETIQIV